jgi:hypothetical protein
LFFFNEALLHKVIGRKGSQWVGTVISGSDTDGFFLWVLLTIRCVCVCEREREKRSLWTLIDSRNTVKDIPQPWWGHRSLQKRLRTVSEEDLNCMQILKVYIFTKL